MKIPAELAADLAMAATTKEVVDILDGQVFRDFVKAEAKAQWEPDPLSAAALGIWRIFERPDKSTDDVKRALNDYAAHVLASTKPAYHVPGPYEIALAMGAALVSTGRYETPGAAMSAAWFAIPEFYSARDAYLRDMVPALQAGVNLAAADE